MRAKAWIISLVLLFGCVTTAWAQPKADFTISGVPGQSAAIDASQGPLKICVNTRLVFNNTSTPKTTTRSSDKITYVCFSFPNATVDNNTDYCDDPSFVGPVPVTFGQVGTSNVSLIAQDNNSPSKNDTITIAIQVVAYTNPSANFSVPASQCGLNSFDFKATASGLQYAWQFNGSSTTSSTNQDVTIQFDQAIGNGVGNYNVTLTVTDKFGCSATNTQSVAVNQIPDATITSNNAQQTTYGGLSVFTFCNGLASDTFNFSNASSTIATNVKYDIKWGNATNSVFDSVNWNGIKNIVYKQGFDTLKVSVTGGDGCINTKQYGVYVGQQPGSGLNSPQGKTVFCIGTSIPFAFTQSDSSNPAGTSYEITIRENPLYDTIIYQSDILKNWPYYFNHTFNQSSCGVNDPRGSDPNAFAVNINAINACATALNGPGTIHISARPGVKINGPDVICKNNTAVFTNNTTWDGVYPYCSSATPPDEQQVWQVFPPTGGSYKILNNAGSLNPYSSGDNTLNVVFNGNGTYRVRLYVRTDNSNSADCVTGDSSNYSETTICVRNAPFAKFKLDKQTACAPYTFTASQLPDTTLSCSGDSVTWSVDTLANCTSGSGGIVIDTGTSSSKAKITFPQAGTYVITLNVASLGGGCAKTFNDTITVYDKAHISNWPDSLGSFCVGQAPAPTFTIDSCFSNGSNYYKWIFTGGTPDTVYGLTPPTITYNAQSPPGRDTIKFSATNGCGTVYDTSFISIISKPVVNNISNKSICSGDSVGLKLSSPNANIVYYWMASVASGTPAGYSSSSGQFIPDVLTCTAKSVVTYKIWGEIPGGCVSDTVTVKVTVSPGVTANAGPDQFLCKYITSTTLAATSPVTGTGYWTVFPSTLPATFANKTDPTTSIKGLLQDTLYKLVWTISNTGSQCVDSTDTVIISTKPIINIIDTPSTICPGQQLVINGEQPTGSDSTAYTYQWQQSSNNTTFNAVTSGTTLNSLSLPSLSSNNYYRRIVSSHSCSDTSNVVQVIVVTEVPQPVFTPHDTSACAPPGGSLSITFRNNTPDKNKFAYTWSVGNNQFSSLADPATQQFATTVSGYGDTTYYITLTASNGCSNVSFQDSVKVKSQPAVIFSAANVLGCSAAPITFTNLSVSSGQDTSETYIWYFGDGSTDTTNNKTVTHVYHNGPPTTYNVILAGSNECGVNTSQPLSVTIDSNHIGLHVDINSIERFICVNDTVHFQNKSSGATSFSWNFGDGDSITTTANIETVPHLYTNAGVYYASVCAINYCMTDTCTHDTITVGARPSASFSALPDTVCAGQSVQFTNTSTPLNDPGIVFTWNFGDGSATSNDGSPAHTYLAGGIDTAWLVASRQFLPGFPASFSCPDSAFAIISVDQPLGTLSYSDTLCQGQTVTFTVNSNSSSHYQFMFGDGSSADINGNVVAHTYTHPGRYLPYVILTGFSGKCFNTITGADTIRVDSIQAAFSLDSVPVCDTTTIKLTDNSFAYFGIQSYEWVVNNTMQTGNLVTQAFTQTGVYDIRLKVTGNSGCSSTTQAFDSVYVHQTPAGTIAVSADTCARDSVYFSASVFSNDPVEYLWNFGNGAQGSGKDAATVYNPAGNYTATLTALTNFGCSVTLTRSVVINTTPDLSITPIDTVRLCKGDTLQLNATGNNIVTWGWGPVDGLSCTTCSNPLAYPTTTTLYTVTGTNNFGCTGVDSVTVNVIQPITVSATPSSVSICLPDSLKTIQFFASGGYNYTWSPATWLDNSNIFDPIVNIPQDSIEVGTQITYTVTGYDQYHCSSNTASVVLSIGLTPVIDLGMGDTGVAGRTVIYQPKLEKNGPFKSFTWSVLSGYGSANCLNGVCDSVQLTINGDVTFQVTAENIYGCTTTDTIHYSAFCNQNEQVFIPTGFSPDGDGINDVFMVQGKGIIVEQFKVFNRWGQVVFDGGSNFAPNLPAYGWNGTLNGTPVTEDVYVYIAKVKCTASNISFFTKGNVTLIRVKK